MKPKVVFWHRFPHPSNGYNRGGQTVRSLKSHVHCTVSGEIELSVLWPKIFEQSCSKSSIMDRSSKMDRQVFTEVKKRWYNAAGIDEVATPIGNFVNNLLTQNNASKHCFEMDNDQWSGSWVKITDKLKKSRKFRKSVFATCFLTSSWLRRQIAHRSQNNPSIETIENVWKWPLLSQRYGMENVWKWPLLPQPRTTLRLH